MSKLNKYSLSKKGKHICPSCEKKRFVLYIDNETGISLHSTVGRCDREDSCGYHYTPKQYFHDHNISFDKKEFTPVKPQPPKAVGTIPFRYVEKSASYNSGFVRFLCEILNCDAIEQLVENYAIGATQSNDVIFWQIDISGKVRTGKIMKYNPETGKRIHETNGINWVHSQLKKQNVLLQDFNLVQCLFGEHLLKIYPTKGIALVESEKTAVISSVLLPNYIWLATGGKSQLSIDKLQVLKGREVVMFPDAGAFDLWSEKAKELQAFCKVSVSDLAERIASDEDKKNGIDIADLFIRQLQAQPQPEEIKQELAESKPIHRQNSTETTENSNTEESKALAEMIEQNTAVKFLIDKLDLEFVA